MTKKRLWWGVLALALTFGITVSGCDNGSTDDASFTVTFDLDGGTYNGSTAPIQKKTKSGKTADIPYGVEKEGHSYDGWYTAKNGGGTRFTSETKVTSDLTVYVKWNNTAPKTMTITHLFGKSGNAIYGNVIIKIINRAYEANSTAAMSSKTAISNNSVTVQLKKGNIEFVLEGGEIVDWTGSGSYLIQLETVGQGLWNYTNGKTWAELGITNDTSDKDFWNTLPKYDITEPHTIISLDQFQDQVNIPSP
jgi:hypothetical protein